MANNWYRTKDSEADYRFRFHRQWLSGNYRVYIVSQPSYRGRDESLHTTHRLTDSSGYYVCWTTPIRSEHNAHQIASMWADKTQEYIKYGTRF